MCNGYLIAALAICAAAVSGCQTTSPDFGGVVTTATGGGGTGGTGTGGTGGTGTTSGTGGTASTSSSTFSPGDSQNSGTGTPAITVLSDGDPTIAFNTSGQSPNSGALISVTPSGNNVAVAVDDATGGALAWPEPITLPIYAPGTARGNLRGTHSLLIGASPGASYEEHRRIDGTTDAELQVWNYDHSHIGQYRVWVGGNTPDDKNLAVFHGGNQTNPANLPATATYNGRMGATATAANWVPFDRTAPDRDAADPTSTYQSTPILDALGNPVLDISGNPTFTVTAESVNPNGEWRVTGDVNLNANFGAGTVNGTFSNMVWKKWQPNPGEKSDRDGYITIYDADEVRNPFPGSYTLNTTTSGSDFSGTVTANGPYVNGNNHATGSVYGPNGEEAAGIFYNEATSPGPDDGLSPYEENRRGFVNVRGIFQGTQ